MKEVELWGEKPPRVLTVGQKVETVAIYVVVADGAGEIEYRASGLHAKSGRELWTPHAWKVTGKINP